ncbi:MAG: hypothetical protein HY927_02855 [Elusimicrobia bacterium]|nr:hypothetical protein [Elusimicrobiota bacterium]
MRPEDVVAMKLAAGGGQDWQDAAGIIRVQGDKLDLTVLDEACRARKALSALKKLRESL